MLELTLTTVIVIGALLALIFGIIRSFRSAKHASTSGCGCNCGQCMRGTAACLPETNEGARMDSIKFGAHTCSCREKDVLIGVSND